MRGILSKKSTSLQIVIKVSHQKANPVKDFFLPINDQFWG